MNYLHGGDYGDIVYALSAVRDHCALLGQQATITLHPLVGTRVSMDESRAHGIRRLLEAQDYVNRVTWVPRAEVLHGRDIDLNRFRSLLSDGRTIIDAHRLLLGLPAYSGESWLTAPRSSVRFPVFARSARYHNPDFPWNLWVSTYPFARFVGTADEYAAFVSEFGVVSFLSTRDLLDAAGVINGCSLFAGNQSCPAAIAHGLGVRPMYQETIFLAKGLDGAANCMIHREGCRLG